MSRICGVYSTEGHKNSSFLLSELISTLSNTKPKDTLENIIEHSNVQMGWCGLGADALVETELALTAFDGELYQVDYANWQDNKVEALTRLFENHGMEDVLARCNGDFAFALYDKRNKSLYLARDRFGLKPLYYTFSDGYFAFASEPQALLTAPWLNKRVNRKYTALFAVSHYRYFDNNPRESPYEGIFQLPAASYIKYDGNSIAENVYWRLSEQGDYIRKEEALAEEYRNLLFDSVKIRLNRSKRPAFSLSGGMDSSSVLASAVHVSGFQQTAFSSVYEDKTFDEAEDIKTILSSLVERWHPVPVEKPDIFGLVEKMVAVHGEPVATATWLSHFLLCQEAASLGFTELFGGLGGDELNAGEYEYFPFHFADLKYNGLQSDLVNEIEMWAKYHDHPIYPKNQKTVDNNFASLIDFSEPGRCRPDRKRINRYKDALNPDYFNISEFEPVMEHPFSSYLKNRTYQDLTRETMPCCLRAEDRQGSAFGIRNILPFLDHRLVEFMYRIPGSLKIRNGVTKQLLRRAMRGFMPDSTVNRVRKTGWNVPAHIWFAQDSRDQLLDMVKSLKFRQRGIYRAKEVERIIEEHFDIVKSGRAVENHMMFIWQMINLELWMLSLYN